MGRLLFSEQLCDAEAAHVPRGASPVPVRRSLRASSTAQPHAAKAQDAEAAEAAEAVGAAGGAGAEAAEAAGAAVPPSCLVVQGSDGLVGLIWLQPSRPAVAHVCVCGPRDFTPPRLRDSALRRWLAACTTRHAQLAWRRRAAVDQTAAEALAARLVALVRRCEGPAFVLALHARLQAAEAPAATDFRHALALCRDAVAARIALGRVPRAAAGLGRLGREVEAALAAHFRRVPDLDAPRRPSPPAMRAPGALAPAASYLFGARGARPIFLRLEALLGASDAPLSPQAGDAAAAAVGGAVAAAEGGEGSGVANVVPLAPGGFAALTGVEGAELVLHVLTIKPDGRGGASSAGYVGGVGACGGSGGSGGGSGGGGGGGGGGWAVEEAGAEVGALCGSLRELVAVASLRALAAEPLTGHVVREVWRVIPQLAEHVTLQATVRLSLVQPAVRPLLHGALAALQLPEAGLALTAVDGTLVGVRSGGAGGGGGRSHAARKLPFALGDDALEHKPSTLEVEGRTAGQEGPTGYDEAAAGFWLLGVAAPVVASSRASGSERDALTVARSASG